MKEALKKHYKDLILVICYIVLALVVYCVWMYSVFTSYKILFTILTGLVILAIGCVIGFLYLKPMIKEELNNENKEAEPNVAEVNDEVKDDSTSNDEAKEEVNTLEESPKEEENKENNE